MRQYHRKVNGEPTRVLVRHADAGDRADWNGPDELRNLTAAGLAQAEELAERIGGMPIVRMLSSPALRCLQTVVPLARRLSVGIELSALLRVDADPARLAAFLRDPASDNAVLCTHRETLTALFALLVPGTPVPDDESTMPMAAAWMLIGGADQPCRLRAIGPLAADGRSVAAASRYDTG